MTEANIPVLRGFLSKQGAKGLVKGWKKRWFDLKNKNQLHYYKGADEVQSLGFIDIALITGVRETPNSSGKRDKGEFLFEVYTPGRVYHLMAYNESLMRYWIDGLTTVMSILKNGVPAVSAPPSKNLAVEKKALSGSLASSESEQAVNGKLTITVVSASDVAQRIAKNLYVVVAIENQQARTRTTTNGTWNEEFFLDVSDLSLDLNAMVWSQEDEINSKFIGSTSMKLSKIKEKFEQQEREESFPLAASANENHQPRGDLKLKLLYTIDNRHVGVEDFELLKVLGKGNFGKVMQVRKKDTSRIYAMKVLKKSSIIAADAIQHTLAETAVLRRIKHPFIVSLKYAFQTDDKLYMILDYLNGGELFFHLSNVDRFPEERSRFYAAEIVLALGYLHHNRVVYRDLKPENLLLSIDGHICLTDFGLVKENLGHGEYTHTFCGSPEYLAPEILQGKGYGKAVDWWALGTLIYEMLEGLPPFYDEDMTEMNRRILRQPLYFDASHFSVESMSLLEGLLQRDPEKRLGTGPTDYLELTSHAFFKSVNWEDLYNKKVEPSFKPHLTSSTDARYFDTEFTSQDARHSVVTEKLSKTSQRAFDGFSYMPGALADKRKSVRASRGPNHIANQWRFNPDSTGQY